MKHTITKPTETVADVTCDACGNSTKVKGGGLEFGILQAAWGYGSKHDGERYEVHLCESCFFSTLSNLRRNRLLSTMFDKQPGVADENFGLIQRDDIWRDN